MKTGCVPHGVIDATRRAYEKVAEDYDSATAAFHQKMLYPNLLALMRRCGGLLRGKRALDVGCGSGRFLELLASHRVIGIGIDIADAFVRNAPTPILHLPRRA
mgnify:CR=1 FL=1